ncbi:MAG: hypothetical protein ABL309_13905 [Phycisphaerales bacterium]
MQRYRRVAPIRRASDHQPYDYCPECGQGNMAPCPPGMGLPEHARYCWNCKAAFASADLHVPTRRKNGVITVNSEGD